MIRAAVACGSERSDRRWRATDRRGRSPATGRSVRGRGSAVQPVRRRFGSPGGARRRPRRRPCRRDAAGAAGPGVEGGSWSARSRTRRCGRALLHRRRRTRRTACRCRRRRARAAAARRAPGPTGGGEGWPPREGGRSVTSRWRGPELLSRWAPTGPPSSLSWSTPSSWWWRRRASPSAVGDCGAPYPITGMRARGLGPTYRAAATTLVVGESERRRAWCWSARRSRKTTVGRVLARRLGLGFLDVDALIVERAGQADRGPVHRNGEDAFRALERAVVAEALTTTTACSRSAAARCSRP